MDLKKIMAGGFLDGYKGYLGAFGLLVTAFVNWSTGITDLQGFIEQLPLVFVALTGIGIRHAIAKASK